MQVAEASAGLECALLVDTSAYSTAVGSTMKRMTVMNVHSLDEVAGHISDTLGLDERVRVAILYRSWRNHSVMILCQSKTQSSARVLVL